MRRGLLMTAKRQKLIVAYLRRHNWVRQWPDTGKEPPMDRWGRPKFDEFQEWERGFGFNSKG